MLASKGSDHGSGSCGARHRFSPDVSAAYGMPRKARMRMPSTYSTVPTTSPCCVCTATAAAEGSLLEAAADVVADSADATVATTRHSATARVVGPIFDDDMAAMHARDT